MIRFSVRCATALLAVLALVCPVILHAQQTDLAVQEIALPPAQVQPGQPLLVRFTIANLGNNAAANFFCGVQIASQSNPGTPLFQEQIDVPGLAQGATQTLQTAQPWVPPAPGPYMVRVAIAYPQDNQPGNNQMTKNFQVEAPGLLSLAEAIDILKEEVLNDHPRFDSLMALHISPPANPSDSLIPPGLRITGMDTLSEMRYDDPVYFFFVDPYPGQFYGHPCEYVAVSAVDGVVDRQPAQIWPTIDGVAPDVGVLCDANPKNPRLVQGDMQPCAAKPNPYTPRATSNKDDWGLVVVGALFKDVEVNAVQHDICMYKERINGGQYGPGVSGENIAVHVGANNRGLTKKELCDAIDAFKGKACRKFYFKYIAHGLESHPKGDHGRGIALWDENRNSSIVMPWDTLACKLKEAGIRNICIEITSCYSGAAIAAFAKKKLRGVVITSSSSSRPTQVGDGSGTPWEKALFACSKDKEADLNKNDTIDYFELYAWVKVKHNSDNPKEDNPLWGDPGARDLTDSIKDVRVKVDSAANNKDNLNGSSGTIKVVRKKTLVLVVPKGGRNTLFARQWIYLQNESAVNNTLNKTYRIIARCKDGERVLWTGEKGRFTLKPHQYLCVAELPPDCINANGQSDVRVEEVKSRAERDKETRSVAAAGDDGYTTYLDYPVPHDPGEFILYAYDYAPFDTNGSFTVAVDAPAGWEPQLGHATFRIPEGDTSHPVHTGVWIPDSATVGGTLEAVVRDVGSGDASIVRYAVRLRDTLLTAHDIEDVVETRWRWYEILEPTRLHTKHVTLSDVRMEVSDSLELDGVGDWSLTNVAIGAGDSAYLKAAIGLGSTSAEWRNVAVRGARDGVVAQGGFISMENVTLASSNGDGLLVRGFDTLVDTLVGTSIERMKSVDVIDAGRHGIVFENLGLDTVRAEGLRFFLIDSNDVVVRDRTTVECLDCEYRNGAVSVDASSSLLRYATLSLAAFDTAANGIAGIEIAVTDARGRAVFSGITDSTGFVPELRALIGRHDGNGFQAFSPFAVTAGNGTAVQRDTLDPVTWTQRVFIFDEGPSSVPRTGEGPDGTRIVEIVPQPAWPGTDIAITTEGLGTRNVGAAIFDTRGETVWRHDRIAVANDRLVIRGFNVASGVYVLRLDPGEGEFLTAKVVVR